MRDPAALPDIPLSEGDVNYSAGRRAWHEWETDAETAYWLAEDERYFLHQSLSTPCLDVLTGCQGSSLEDISGRRFLDFHGNSAHQIGYGHPHVVAALKRQMETLPFCPRRYTNIPAIALARRLADLAPGNLSKVLFCPGGAEAIGIAQKLARVATGKYKTISLWDSFHGASLDTISLGGEALFRQGMGPLLPGAEHIPPPRPAQCLFGCGGVCALRCADFLDYILTKEGDVGAVIAEPIRCTTVEIPPPGYWARVREICDRHGVLLIFDEIPLGLGRTGTMFACEGIGVTPDILVLGKGLGGGMIPMAAVIAREDLDVAGDRALGHYTHEKSPLGAAAGLATLEIIVREGLPERASALGDYFQERLLEMQVQFPLIADVRGIGLLFGVELQTPDGKAALAEADALLYACLRSGLSFKVSGGNVLTLTPPLTISEEEIHQALLILENAFASIS